MRPTNDDLDVAMLISDYAATFALGYAERGVTAKEKEDGTLVSEADPAVEWLIRSMLGELRPADAILGEELSRPWSDLPEEFGASGSGRRIWIIDPIDGSRSYIERRGGWRVHVALEKDGEVLIAVVTAPVQRMQWWAVRNVGTFQAPWPHHAERDTAERLAVSGTSLLAKARVEFAEARTESSPTRRAANLEAEHVGERTVQSEAKVLSGEIDAFVIDKGREWDHAPWILMVEEAGGRFTDWEGGRSAYKGGGVFSNAAIHSQLVEAVGIAPRASSP